MNAIYWNRIGRWAAGLTAGAALAIAGPAWSQQPPTPAPAPKAPVTPKQDPVKPAADPAREAARDRVEGAREAARDRVEGAREGAQDARRDAREGAQDARRDIRDARGDLREARRDARQALRAADLGLWFGARAGTTGLVVADVATQGAIARAGFLEGDRLISVNGTPVTTEAEFVRLFTDDAIRDQQVKVVVMRGGKEQVIVVQPSVLIQEAVAYDPLWQYGIILDDRTPDRLVIQRVFPRTPAFYAGLRSGDVIVSARGQRLAAAADLLRALSANTDRLALQINRANAMRDVQLESSSNFGADVQTLLRPRIDDPNRPATPADTQPRLDAPRPGTPAVPPRPGTTPATPAVPGRPATPPTTTTPALPAVPPIPATPPSTPAAPAAPAPTAPAAPAAPAPAPSAP